MCKKNDVSLFDSFTKTNFACKLVGGGVGRYQLDSLQHEIKCIMSTEKRRTIHR